MTIYNQKNGSISVKDIVEEGWRTGGNMGKTMSVLYAHGFVTTEKEVRLAWQGLTSLKFRKILVPVEEVM